MKLNSEKIIFWFQQYVDEFVELTTSDEYNHRNLETVLKLMNLQQAEIKRLKDELAIIKTDTDSLEL